MLTNSQKAKYLINNNQCPFCDSVDITASISPQTDDGVVWIPMVCKTCGKEWTENYKLINIGE